MAQRMDKEIYNEMMKEIERISKMFGYKNLKVYYGGVTISFECTSLSPLEIQYFESTGMKLGGIDVFQDRKDEDPYMRVSMEVRQN